MIGQLLRRLADAEAATATPLPQSSHQAGNSAPAKFAVCVTGDHSTPVIFGDHSHEPVPLVIAHIEDVVSRTFGRTVWQELSMLCLRCRPCFMC